VTQHINLYHAEFRPPRNPLPAAYLFAGIVLVVAVMLLLYGFESWRLNDQRRNLAALETQAARLEAQLASLSGQVAGRQEDPALAAEIAGLEARLVSLGEAERAIQSGALGSRDGYSGYFSALSRVHVPGVWLVAVDLQGVPVGISLTGRAIAGEDAARYLAALRREPHFGGQRFAALEITRAKAVPAAAEKAPARPDSLEFRLVSRQEAGAEAGGGQP
jgi:Tfp pilus assembly protein PilN